MAKRANNEGSICQIKSGAWVAVLSLPNGKRVRRQRQTQQEALVALGQLRREFYDRGSIASHRDTVAGIVDAWLIAGESKWKPETLRKYKVHREHLVRIFGTTRAADLEPAHVRLLHKDLKAAGLSQTSIGHVHCTARAAMNQALREGTVRRNVFSIVSPPSRDTEEAAPLSPAESTALLAALRGTAYECRLLVALHGLRQGEALALTWKDIDLQRGTLTVRGSLSRTEDGLKVLTTKTARSRRTVALSRRLKAVLAERRRDSISDWVFPGLDPAEPMHPASDWRYVKAALKAAGVRNVRVHDMRHSSAITLLEAGLPMHEVSDHLGHANVSITHSVYSHVLDSQRQRAASALDDLLG